MAFMTHHPLLVPWIFPHNHQEEGCEEEVAQEVNYKGKDCAIEDQRNDAIDVRS